MEIIHVLRIDFDNMENRAATTQKTMVTLVPGDGRSAYGKAQQWFAAQPPTQLYTGYDHQVYPQFKLVTEHQ